MKPETVNNVLRHLKGIVAALEKERINMSNQGAINNEFQDKKDASK